jgi:uncharacterized protein (UPF0332 family)
VEVIEVDARKAVHYFGVAMSFHWSEYLDVAQELAEQAKNAPAELQEARYRASISRAYYAAFGKARDHLRFHENIQEPRPLVSSIGERINIHQYVRETFMSRPGQEGIGADLNRMRLYRNAVDYDDHNLLKRLPFVAQETITRAKRVFNRLDSMQQK